MTRVTRAIAVLYVVLLGVWGCAQGPSLAAQAERIKTLEAKNARLEADFRAAAGSRDDFRSKLAKAEEHIQKLQLVVKERDELKVQLKVRTTERDQVSAQYDQFRKTLRELVGQADSAVLRFSDGEPVTIAVGPRATGQS
jgi:uncharacterized coiled-coil DUF342 family protein